MLRKSEKDKTHSPPRKKGDFRVTLIKNTDKQTGVLGFESYREMSKP